MQLKHLRSTDAHVSLLNEDTGQHVASEKNKYRLERHLGGWTETISNVLSTPW